MTIRNLALPALAASTLLVFCGCDMPAVATGRPVLPAVSGAVASPVVSAAVLPAVPPAVPQAQGAPAAAPAATLVPAPVVAAVPKQARATPSAAPSGRTAKATLAPHPAGPSKVTLAIPGGSGGQPAASAADLTLTSYDKKTGEVVLAAPAGSSGAQAAAVKPGQLIDSPPSAGAPHGVLATVTGVRTAPDGTVHATTRPASVSQLLGSTSTSLHTALAPADIQVQPQVKNLNVSYNVTGITSGNGSASGGLLLSANTSVPLPNGSSAAFSGSVELDPTIDFSYSGGAGIIAPQTAEVGFKLGAHADWHLSAGLTATGTPIKVPIANLSASPVVMVGILPVVVNLDLNLFAEISADGTVTIDAEQSYVGNWGVHSDYTGGKGWTTATDPSSSTVSPLKLNLSGNASVKTGLVAEGSVALYDTVGIKADIEPYLRTQVSGSVVLDGSGSAPVVNGTVGLFGGLDLSGALFARIALFGTTLAEQDLPFATYAQEWPIRSWSTATS